MYSVDFNNIQNLHIHFIGIGGISMSGLAELLLSRGAFVSGSDRQESSLTKELQNKGAVIGYPQKADNIPKMTDLVVATAAIHEDNPELMAAKERNIPVLTRAQLLGQVMKLYDLPLAVAGTHGKTTTTSMITQIMLDNGKDPTASIGGMFAPIGGNFRIGSDRLFVMEACEYTNSFLSFFPKVAVILNVDADHLDFFKNIENIRASFAKFARLLPDDGTLVINGDMDCLDEITKGLKCRILTFGSSKAADFWPENITFDEMGLPSFDLSYEGSKPAFPFLYPENTMSIMPARRSLHQWQLVLLPGIWQTPSTAFRGPADGLSSRGS